MSSGIDLLGPASAVGAVTVRPTDTRIFGSTETWFAPCTSQSSRDGTQLQAVFLNGLLAQIRYVLRASGIDLDNADDAMLWDAIRTLTPAPTLWHYGNDTSSAAAGLSAAVTPAISAYEPFVAYSIKANNAALNGGTQANFGPGLRAVTRADGSPIRRGDWAKGDIVLVIDDGERLRLAGRSAEAPPALWHSGVAGGSPSAVTATVSPAIAEYEARLPILLTFPAGIADAATGALNGLPAIPFQRGDGSPIQKADIPPGCDALFTLMGTTALRLIGLGRGEVQRIAINPTLYVRTDGNDANDGLTNTPAGAFKTITAAAIKGTSQFNFSSSALNIQLGNPGRYDAPGTIPRGTGTINIVGDPANQAAYILSGAVSPGFGVLQCSGAVTTNGLTIENTGAGSHTLAATTGSAVICFNTTFSTTQSTTGAQAFSGNGSITLAAGCIMQGNAGFALSANGGEVNVNTSTVLAIVGNPTFSAQTARASLGGRVTLLAGASVSGTANGVRYLAEAYGIIGTNGGGENAFPGSAPGSATNALYL